MHKPPGTRLLADSATLNGYIYGMVGQDSFRLHPGPATVVRDNVLAVIEWKECMGLEKRSQNFNLVFSAVVSILKEWKQAQPLSAKMVGWWLPRMVD